MDSSRHPLEGTVCDATAIRHFALIDQFDLLANTLDGKVFVPLHVFDPDDNFDVVGVPLSEIGETERYFAARSREPSAADSWSRLHALRQRSDLVALDLDDAEIAAYDQLTSPGFARDHGIAIPLGRGEAAVIAITEHRDFEAALDERIGRQVLQERSPATPVVTTRGLLRRAVSRELVTSPEGELIYGDMLTIGYRGPESLWGD